MNNQEILLGIYKLHATLADHVSQRRDSANRLFAGLLTTLIIFIGALLRFGSGDIPQSIILVAIGLFGIVLSLAWMANIQSYKQLNRLKFIVLHDLETKLPYAFFADEWELLKKSPEHRYWRLTNTEKLLPTTYIILSIGIIVYALALNDWTIIPGG